MHINVAELPAPLLSKSARSDESLDSWSISDDDVEISDEEIATGECAVGEVEKLSFENEKRLVNVSIRVSWVGVGGRCCWCSFEKVVRGKGGVSWGKTFRVSSLNLYHGGCVQTQKRRAVNSMIPDTISRATVQ